MVKAPLLKKQSITGLPLIHLDKTYWNDEWPPTSAKDWEEYQREITKNEKWIMDGNYGYTLDLRISACDTVIFLDYSRFICTFRPFKRIIVNPREVRDDLGLRINLILLFSNGSFSFPIGVENSL